MRANCRICPSAARAWPYHSCNLAVVGDNTAGQGYSTVNVYRAPGAVKIELNRPDRLNAWSDALSADLLKIVREVAADDQVRAVMLTGAGRSFCSGADLKE